jgi:hypothetical protein
MVSSGASSRPKKMNGTAMGLPSPRECIRTLSLLSALGWLTPAQAHDFWIEPASFRPAVGTEVPLRLFVGQDFVGEPTVYLPDTFERYVVVGPDGERHIAGIPGDDPAGRFTVVRPGAHVVAYRSTLFTVTFDTPAEFEQYLEKEGLERVKTWRAKKAPTRQVIRENYSRSAKSLVLAGRPDAHAESATATGLMTGRTSTASRASDSSRGPRLDPVADRVLGLRLELVAEKNPALTPRVPLRLLYEGRPLADALVVAFNQAEPLKKLKARTDRDGRVQFDFNRRGVWLVTSVHMFPAPARAGADWESVWASLTFERP